MIVRCSLYVRCVSSMIHSRLVHDCSHLRNPDASSSRVESWPGWEYIGAQGPLPHTTADFWELAYEQGCSVILMLTNTVELNIVKVCFAPSLRGLMLSVLRFVL